MFPVQLPPNLEASDSDLNKMGTVWVTQEVHWAVRQLQFVQSRSVDLFWNLIVLKQLQEVFVWYVIS